MEKIGRNDPCPCGSGKKYKKCCEATLSRKGMTNRKIENKTQVSGLSHLFKSLVHLKPKAPPAAAGSTDEKT